jgi:3',5'-cyclic AMP phosphodiesterase CpdA
MTKATILILFLFVLNLQANISMQPYLMGVTSNSVYVLVECSTTTPVTVNYGYTTSYGMSASDELYTATLGSTYVHKIKLTGLLPDTIYHYQAVQLTSSSTDSYFRTAPLPGKSFRFAWEADMRTNTSPHDQIAALINAANPVLLLQGGDVCSSSNYTTFKSEFFRTNELSVISHVPFVWAPGNHETWGTNTKAFSKAPQSGSGLEDYYSFDYGDIHFLVLNTQLSYSVGSVQYNWAMSDLSSTTRKWKIVIAHVPGYTAGGSGAHVEDPNMIAMAVNIFTPKGVDLVLNGHNHFYQHNRVSGIDYIVIGSAGAPLYPTGTASYTIKSVSDYCYGIFDITPNSLKMSVYNNVNKLLDILTWTKISSSSISVVALIEAMYVSGGNGMTMNPSVTLELHNSSTYAQVESQTGTLNTAGAGTFTFTTAVNGIPYYLAIKSPNTLETWSATAQSLTSGELTYDFTSGLEKVYTDGSNPPLALHNGKYCIYSGDVNQDGFFTGDDFTGVDNDGSNFDYHLINDLNGDGFVTGDDFMFIDNNGSNFIHRQVPPGAPDFPIKGVIKSKAQ